MSVCFNSPKVESQVVFHLWMPPCLGVKSVSGAAFLENSLTNRQKNKRSPMKLRSSEMSVGRGYLATDLIHSSLRLIPDRPIWRPRNSVSAVISSYLSSPTYSWCSCKRVSTRWRYLMYSSSKSLNMRRVSR